VRGLSTSVGGYMAFLVVYIIACAIVGIMAKNTTAGPILFFLLSLIITPVITIFFLLLARDKKRSQV
jgi:hypothetical protein